MKKFSIFLLLVFVTVVFASCGETTDGKGSASFNVIFIVDGVTYSTIKTSGNEIINMPDDPVKDGFAFDGWFSDKDVWEKAFAADSLSATALTADLTVYCKWAEDVQYILFGEYPQTIKARSVSITEETDVRGYYLGSDGKYYAKLTTASNVENKYSFSDGNAIESGVEYYFMIEPIKWRMLSETDGKMTLLCKSIIDVHRFASSSSSNNYEESEIRQWLNDYFYKTAFSDDEKVAIISMRIDNGEDSTYPENDAAKWNNGENIYACDDTFDKVWLLSVNEVTNAEYGFSANAGRVDKARKKVATDYARANNIKSFWDNSTAYDDCIWWWLRSPAYNDEFLANHVRINGDGGMAGYTAEINRTYFGVVPAITVSL